MAGRESLYLYEEILLLALRDEKGTIITGYPGYLIAGAILAELLMDERISVEDTKKQMVDVVSTRPTGDEMIDECLEKMATAKRRGSLQTWVSRLGGIKKLQHRVAEQLCERGILRADEDKILFIFTRKIYPEIDPVPEREIIERLRDAIFSERDNIDARTVVLISLADGVDLLQHVFGRKEIRNRRTRIEQIINGELTGKATKQLIIACQTAAMVAAIMPAITSATIHH